MSTGIEETKSEKERRMKKQKADLKEGAVKELENLLKDRESSPAERMYVLKAIEETKHVL